jgi:beta-phosphoglucomutase-like phosphatase (HAD superfamily)
MYKHIIWDFDGTLFDTYPVMTAAFRKALEDEGINESIENIMRLMRISESHLLEYCRNKYGISESFRDSYDNYRKELYKNDVKPFPEVSNVCRTLFLAKKHNYLYTHRGKSAMEFLEKNYLDRYKVNYLF